MAPHRNPLGRACRANGRKLQPSVGWDRVGLQHPDRVAVPEDGGKVVGFVHAVHEHGEVGLASVEHRTQATIALGRQGIPLLEVGYIGEDLRSRTEMVSPLSSIRTSARLGAAIFCLCSFGSCDRRGFDLIVEPEFEDAFSFETDFSDWTPQGRDLTDPPVVWEVARSGERASDGEQAIRLRLDNLNSQGKIWIERRYEVEENQVYSVEISFDFGSADWGDVNLWRLLAGGGTDPPSVTGSLSVRGDSGNGESSDQGYRWVPNTYEMELRSGTDGELFVYVGIWGTSAFLRTYYLDNIQVVLTRQGFSNF